MRWICFLLCLFALFVRAMQTYRRVGNPVYPAIIVGFCRMPYQPDSSWCNFKVEYRLNNQTITAISIESASISSSNENDYLGQPIEVYVNGKTPTIVSIKGNHCLDFPCLFLLVIGVFGIFLF